MMNTSIDGKKIIIDQQHGWCITRSIIDTEDEEVIKPLVELGWKQPSSDLPDWGWAD